MQQEQRRRRANGEWMGIVIIAIGVAVAVFAGLLYWYGSTHLVVTHMRPGRVAPAATDIVVWFNKPISANTAKHFSISPAVSGTTRVKGNTLTFTPDRLLADGQTYTATISQATSSDEKLKGGKTTCTFKVGFVPYDELSKDVQERELKFTDNQPPELAYFGEGDLLDQGVTSEQIPYIESFLKQTFDRTPKTDYAINIENVISAPFDPNQDAPVSRYTFDVLINDVYYKVALDSEPLGDIHLRLYNTAGKLLDDSGVITPT